MTVERAVAAFVGLLLLAVAKRAARKALRRTGTPFTVLPLYLGLWGATFVLFAVPLIAYSPTPLAGWVALYGAVLTGAGAAWRVERRPLTPAPGDAPLRQAIHRGRLRLAWAASAVLGLLGLLSFVYAVSRVLPWTAVLTDPAAVRDVKRDSATFQQTYGLLKLLTYFNQVAFVLWTVGLRLRAFDGRWRLARFAGVVSPMPFLFTADRGLLVATVVWAGVLHLIWPQRVAPRRAAALVVAGILVAGVAVTAIGNRYGGSLASHPEIAAALTTRAVDPVAIPYLYLTGNIPTFGQLTADPLAPLDLGGMTLLPLVKAAQLAGAPVTPPVGNGVFYPIPFESFSNYGWLGTFWLDFRLLGALLLPALVLGLAALAQRRVLTRPSLGPLWIASVLLYVVVFSPFANALSTPLPWQYLLLTPVIVLALDREAGSAARRRIAAAAPRRLELASLAALAVVASGAAAMALRGGGEAGTPMRPDQIESELAVAAAKAHLVYREHGRYPATTALAGQLQVNRPDLVFDTLDSFRGPAERGVIAVFARPDHIIMRARAADGRLYEVHRIESFGGVTFGPGTRDG